MVRNQLILNNFMHYLFDQYCKTVHGFKIIQKRSTVDMEMNDYFKLTLVFNSFYEGMFIRGSLFGLAQLKGR